MLAVLLTVVVLAREPARRAALLSEEVGRIHLHAARSNASAVQALPTSRCSSFGEPQLVAEAARCPSECPYSQAFGCGKMCVVAENCAVLAPARPFADPQSFTCRQPCGDTNIPGCARCAGPGVCEQCAEGLFGLGWLELADGGRKCVNHAERVWQLVYSLLALAFLCVAFYAVQLYRRPVLNGKVVEAALKKRDHNSHRGGRFGYWGPSIDDGLAGCGVPLYFRAVLLVLAGAVVAGVVAGAANPENWTEPKCAVQHMFTAVEQYEDPNDHEGEPYAWADEFVEDTWRRLWGPNIESLPSQLHHAPHRTIFFAFLYLFLSVGGVICFAWQHRTRDALHQDFALRLSNLPPDVTDAQEIAKHVDSFGTPCVGVSICYDYAEHRDAVDKALAGDPGSHEDGIPGLRKPERGVQTDEALELTPALRGPTYDHASLADSWLMPCLGVRERGPVPILGSGYAFVVFPTPADARRALIRINARGAVPLVAAKGGRPHRLAAEAVDHEPSEVYWENYGGQMNFLLKICLGVVAMIGTAVLWLLLSMPYAILFAGQVLRPTMGSTGTGQEMLLGLLIALGNALVGLVIERVTFYAGFYEKRSRDLAVVVMAFWGTLANTLFDLAVLIVVAKGASLNAAFEGAEEGYPRVLASQLYQLIVPGYLFVPVFAVPVFERVLPYYLGLWFVRSKPRVLQRDADAALAHKEFDICWRYADVLNNFTICLTLMFLPSGNSWRVMVAFAGFCFLIWALDRYILLYCSVQTPYATPVLYRTFWWLWMVPTGALALVVGFWAVHAQFVSSWWLLPVLLGVHVTVFSALLFFLSGTAPVREEQYSTVLARLPGSFFSTNPVLRLRARVLGDLHGDDGQKLFSKP